jgi:hypothetical protein
MLNKGQIELMQALRRGGKTTAEVANALGCDIEQATARLQFVRRKGLASCAGVWTLTEAGRVAAGFAKLGPPRKPKSEVLHSAPSRLTVSEKAKARKLGGGNLSAGIRLAVQRGGGSVK